jgi:hypothetical protein
MEEAIQWWYGRQMIQLESQARQIRDRLLQDSCAVRRSLELSLLQPNKPTDLFTRQCLEQFTSFYAALKELNDCLSPPYLEEGLPLAIEYLVKTWQQKLPDCEFRLELSDNWQPKSQDKDRIILTILEELFKLLLSESAKEIIIFICLQQTRRDNKLEIETIKLNSSHCSRNFPERENLYLGKSFEMIASGKYHFTSQEALEKLHNFPQDLVISDL